jgi:Lon protease-like protein
LWVARAWLIDDDAAVAPAEGMVPTVRALANAIGTLERKSGSPFVKPYRFDDAGWVSNRWCELLPISLAAKQKLMALEDPQMRLKLVDEYLRGKGVVSG